MQRSYDASNGEFDKPCHDNWKLRLHDHVRSRLIHVYNADPLDLQVAMFKFEFGGKVHGDASDSDSDDCTTSAPPGAMAVG